MKIRFWRKREPTVEHTHEPKLLSGIEREEIEAAELASREYYRQTMEYRVNIQCRVAELETKFGAELQELESLRLQLYGYQQLNNQFAAYGYAANAVSQHRGADSLIGAVGGSLFQ